MTHSRERVILEATLSTGDSMPWPSAERRIYRFGAFEVDVPAGEVRKQGIRIRVQDPYGPENHVCSLGSDVAFVTCA